MGSTRSRSVRAAAMIAALSGLAVLALGQPGARTPQPTPAEPPVLRGPSVEETGIPGTERAFTMEGNLEGPQARMFNREVPMAEFMGALRALNAPDTSPDLNLSTDQRAALGEIALDQARAAREYMAGHREELAALGATLGFEPDEIIRGERLVADRLAGGERRAQWAAGNPDSATPQPGDDAAGAPPPRRAGNRPARSGPDAAARPEGDARPAARPERTPEQMIRERVGSNPTPEQQAALARLRDIRAGAPSALEAQTRAWNILREPQQQFVQARIDEARARMQAQRGEMYVQEMVDRGVDQPGRVPPGAPEAALDLPPGEAASRLHRLIDDLTPREQAILLRLLENRLPELRARAAGVEDGAPGRSGPSGGPRRQPPPPPEMDQINVPPADPV